MIMRWFRIWKHTLDETIRLILATWEGESASFAGNILRAVARVVYCYEDSLDHQMYPIIM